MSHCRDQCLDFYHEVGGGPSTEKHFFLSVDLNSKESILRSNSIISKNYYKTILNKVLTRVHIFFDSISPTSITKHHFIVLTNI